jgi:hypothetical protein
MVEVMGSQSMVSITLNLFLSRVKVSLYKPLYPILERELWVQGWTVLALMV